KKSGQNRDIAQYFLRKPGAHGRVRSCKNEGGMIPAPLRADGMKTIRLFRRGKCFARNASVNPRASPSERGVPDVAAVCVENETPAREARPRCASAGLETPRRRRRDVIWAPRWWGTAGSST